ncbi:MAG TPA: hypothetical protein VNN77_15130 [candidate division Zixibacteria bacterium]|nr:hypothetical protein [candidate division Zixibacteria bacterium]
MNFASRSRMVLGLRVVHVLAAALLVGAALFDYFLLRPAVRLIPPAHGTALQRRTATVFISGAWIALALLLLTGLHRLYLREDLGILASTDLFVHGHGRAMLIMIIAWLASLASLSAMIFILRPLWIEKLSARLGLPAGGGDKKTIPAGSARWVDRLRLLNMIASALALLAGSSVAAGGLF